MCVGDGPIKGLDYLTYADVKFTRINKKPDLSYWIQGISTQVSNYTAQLSAHNNKWDF